MKRFLLAACIGFPVLLYGQQPPLPHTPIGPSARYQILVAEVGDVGVLIEKTVFLLDTETGEVWKYQPPFMYTDSEGKKKTAPGLFVSVDQAYPSPRPK